MTFLSLSSVQPDERNVFAYCKFSANAFIVFGSITSIAYIFYLIDIAKIHKQFVCGSGTFSYREAKNMYTYEWFGKVSHKFLCCQGR